MCGKNHNNINYLNEPWQIDGKTVGEAVYNSRKLTWYDKTADINVKKNPVQFYIYGSGFWGKNI